MSAMISSFEDLLDNKGIESLGNCRINATTKRQLCCKCLEMKNLGNSHFIPFACLLRIGQSVAQYGGSSQSEEGMAQSSDPHWTRKLFCGNCKGFFSALETAVDNICVGNTDIRVFPRLTDGKFREQSAWCGLGYSDMELKLPAPIQSSTLAFYASVIFRCILIHKETEQNKKWPVDPYDLSVAKALHAYFTSEHFSDAFEPPVAFCVALECSDSDFAAQKPRPWDCTSESYDTYQSLYWTADAGISGHIQIGHVHIYYGPGAEQWKFNYVSMNNAEFQKVHKAYTEVRERDNA
jgi:hypothetical protein